MYQTPGLSDLFVVVDGRFFAIEVKRPREDGGPGCERGVTEKQHIFLGRVKDAGGISGCVESVEAAVHMVYGKEPHG
jgi:hypothetical protein